MAQQADDDLHLCPLAVTIVAKSSHLILASLQIAAGHIVEKKGRLLGGRERFKEPPLNAALLLAKPRQVGIEIVLIKARQAQQIATRMAAGQAHRAQPRALIKGPGDHLPQRQPALAMGGGALHVMLRSKWMGSAACRPSQVIVAEKR